MPLTLRVGEVIGVASPGVYGVNYGIMMNVVDFREDFARLTLTSLRYPPGNIADERPMDALTVRDFLVGWRLLGGDKPLLLVANLFSGTPEAAAAAVAGLLEAGVPLVGVAIGNEPDLYGPNRGAPEWTPARYCEAFRAYRAAIDTVDASVRLAGPSVSGAPQAEAYLAEVLRLCGDVIDILSWHIYPTDGSAPDAVALASSSQVGETIRRYRAWARDPARNPLGYTRELTLAITEFGLSWRTNNYRHLHDTVATLWLADALGQMLANGLTLAHYFALQGIGGHGLIDQGGWRRPTYYLFEMLQDFHGEVLAVQSNLADLRAYAVKTPESLQLLLINISTEDVAVTLELPESGAQQATLRLLSDDTYEIYDDSVAYITVPQRLSEPTLVPARALAHLTIPR
jgi:hypothetical protein